MRVLLVGAGTVGEAIAKVAADRLDLRLDKAFREYESEPERREEGILDRAKEGALRLGEGRVVVFAALGCVMYFALQSPRRQDGAIDRSMALTTVAGDC